MPTWTGTSGAGGADIVASDNTPTNHTRQPATRPTGDGANWNHSSVVFASTRETAHAGGQSNKNHKSRSRICRFAELDPIFYPIDRARVWAFRTARVEPHLARPTAEKALL
jgi:hypothetical protein